MVDVAVFRAGLEAVPKGNIDAAKAIGLIFTRRLSWVILPQAIRRALPPWVNTTAEVVKGTTLVSIISVAERLPATGRRWRGPTCRSSSTGRRSSSTSSSASRSPSSGAALARRSAHLRS